jgi:uncharacterized protein (DUF2237 family)
MELLQLFFIFLLTVYSVQPSTTNMEAAKNVLGGALQTCCTDPMTGFYRDGKCNTGEDDYGTHVICAEMTAEFLAFTKSKGNDLITPKPHYRFPGLKPGDKWCLCALRWREAFQEGVAPPVVLERTHKKALQFVKLEDLQAHELTEK